MEIKLDACGKSMGRVASDVARILMDKDNVFFASNKVFEGKVIVENLDKAKIDAKKLTNKKYYRHSGIIGNLKEETMKVRIEKDLDGFFIKMVKNMLPDNKIREKRLSKVKIVK